MAQFIFTIPADSISSGSPASDVEIRVDRNFSRSVSQNVLVASFGDGYEQRVADGINTKKEEFTISLNNRTAEEINEVAAFFDAYAGKSFVFTTTEYVGDVDIHVVCDSYNITYLTDNYHSLSAVFKRVYTP